MARHAKKQPTSVWRNRLIGLTVFIAVVILAIELYEVLRPDESRWKNLTYEAGRYTYTVEDEVLSQIGIDVSDHDGFIDWQAVAADDIDFAFIRAGYRGYTEGGLFVDQRFDENYTRARANGLAVGLYIFSQATSEQEAIEEADFVLDLLHGRELELPIVFDWETVNDASGRANGMTRTTLTPCAVAFCKRIEVAGYQSMIYMNRKDSERYDLVRLYDYPIWYAEYGTNHPLIDIDQTIWQYSDSGHVDGITTATDMNVLFLDGPRPVYASE